MSWLGKSSEHTVSGTRKESTQDLQGKVDAINRSQAVIEFTLDGTIVHANENFLKTLGYTLDEVKGKHHSMFAEPSYSQSSEYRAFWQKLGRGEFDASQYKRIGKGGREIWIQASYNPIMDAKGRPCKVVKFATDITEQKKKAADYEGQIAAISKSQAVIEFTLDGTIIHANENFLKTLGYTLDEVKGRHHSMFAEPIARSGRSSAVANMTPHNTSGSARTTRKSGFRRATIQFSMRAASPSRLSSTRPTLRRRCLRTRR
jgi:methyl-accepting chemotaxis protein